MEWDTRNFKENFSDFCNSAKKMNSFCPLLTQIREHMCLETHFQYENSVLGCFGQSGLLREKNFKLPLVCYF